MKKNTGLAFCIKYITIIILFLFLFIFIFFFFFFYFFFFFFFYKFDTLSDLTNNIIDKNLIIKINKLYII